MTPKEEILIKLASKGANDAHLILLDKINELEERLDEIKMPDLEQVLESVRGKQGKEGEKGEVGDIGPQGEQGPQGQTGATGAKGDKGDKGLQGEKGENGKNGKNGIDGKNGKDGKDGERGEKGEAGKSGTSFRIGGGFSKIAMDQHFIDDETPSGLVNDVNTDFILASYPNPITSLKVYVNGQRMRLTEDYTFTAKTITFLTAPPTGSILLCDYRH